MSLATRLLPAAGGGGSFPVTWDGLRPWSSVSATKSGSNPTFNFDAVPESVVLVGSTYWCSYQDWTGDWDIRLASASDPAGPWTAYAGNPIITRTTSGWENVGTSPKLYAPEIMQGPDGTFYIFYSFCDATDGSDGKIGVASASTVTGPYTKYASNPILSTGTAGAWDSLRVGEPSVFHLDGTWVMAYMGEDTDFAFGASERIGIATASSPFGPWTKAAGNPLVDWGASGQWDDNLTADPFVWHENGYWWIWYSGAGTVGPPVPAYCGLASASDPAGPWTRHPDNPILTTGGSGAFDEDHAFRGCVFAVGNARHVVYAGFNAGRTVARGGNAVLNVS
jgi:Glycosyl hydrolases family 43